MLIIPVKKYNYLNNIIYYNSIIKIDGKIDKKFKYIEK
jgi:hypothetical protein